MSKNSDREFEISSKNFKFQSDLLIEYFEKKGIKSEKIKSIRGIYWLIGRWNLE